MVGKIIVVSIVLGITGICAIMVASAGSEGHRRVTEISTFSSQEADSPPVQSPDSSHEPQRSEAGAVAKERNTVVERAQGGSAQGSPYSRPSSPLPSASPTKQAASPIPMPEMNENDIVASAFLGDPADSVGKGHVAILGDPNASQEAKTAVERDRIEREMKKLSSEMTKRTNTVATRLKLDQYQRESINQITEQTLEQIRKVREQFAVSQMTDYDKQIMNSQIKDAYRAAGENIRYALGDEKYKEFRKESNYYNNPDQRIYDMMKTMEEQKKQLEKIERNTRSPRGSRKSDQ